jgi:hypothetical protein
VKRFPVWGRQFGALVQDVQKRNDFAQQLAAEDPKIPWTKLICRGDGRLRGLPNHFCGLAGPLQVRRVDGGHGKATDLLRGVDRFLKALLIEGDIQP